MKYRGLLITQIILFIAYLASITLFGRLGFVLIPMHNLVAAYFIFKLTRQMDSSKLQWHLLSLMIAIRAVGEMMKFVVYLLGVEHMMINAYVIILFALSSFILLCVVITYFAAKLNRYAIAQVVADGLFVMLIILGTGSGLYFAGIEMVPLPIVGLISGIVYSMIVFLILVIMFILLISTRNKVGNRPLIGVAIAVFIHVLADGHVIGHYFLTGGIQTVISNVLMLISFNLLVLTAYLKVSDLDANINAKLDRKDNFGTTWFVYILVLIPFVTFSIGFIDMTHLAVLSLVIILYLLFNFVIQRQLATDALLVKEQLIKADLEVLVNEKTKELQRANIMLMKEVTLDPLTELYNRRYFMNVIKEKAEVIKAPFSVFFIDLNRFKVINDIHGHAMGDQILKMVAERFKEFNQGKLRIARFGGDEFAVVLDECDLLTLEMIAVDITDTIRKPLIVEDFEFNIDASIGVARYPIDAVTVGELLKYADIAMYHAKKIDKSSSYVMHSDNFAQQIQRRNRIELLLKNADIENDFTLFYQPQYEIATGKLIGMEALMRWHHQLEGFISPGEFIPISEEIGMIQVMSDWVFKKAMYQINEWNRAYEQNWVMSMNVSPVSLDSGNFITKLGAIIRTVGVKPEWLGFEITEHSAMSTATQMEEFLVSLSGMGVEISIDDFGTGYSSLSYLKRFEVDVLKIAKELIDNIEDDYNDQHIVKAIIMMAEGMGMKTIAEGVETDQQLSFLFDEGCDMMQGYLFSRPIPADDIPALLSSGKRL